MLSTIYEEVAHSILIEQTTVSCNGCDIFQDAKTHDIIVQVANCDSNVATIVFKNVSLAIKFFVELTELHTVLVAMTIN